MNPIQKAIYLDVFGDPSLNSPEERKEDLVLIDHALLTNNNGTLRALYSRGPLLDGDVPSKQQRDWLLENDYCAKVVVEGLDGYNACTYKGAWLHRCLDSLYKRFDQSEALHPDAPATEAPLVAGMPLREGDALTVDDEGKAWPVGFQMGPWASTRAHPADILNCPCTTSPLVAGDTLEAGDYVFVRDGMVRATGMKKHGTLLGAQASLVVAGRPLKSGDHVFVRDRMVWPIGMKEPGTASPPPDGQKVAGGSS